MLETRESEEGGWWWWGISYNLIFFLSFDLFSVTSFNLFLSSWVLFRKVQINGGAGLLHYLQVRRGVIIVCSEHYH